MVKLFGGENYYYLRFRVLYINLDTYLISPLCSSVCASIRYRIHSKDTVDLTIERSYIWLVIDPGK